MSEALLWPRYAHPADLAEIESIPLAQRHLPESTYAILRRAAARWPDRMASSALPDGAHWEHPRTRTFRQLGAEVTRAANLLHS
ncbi:MAG: acyl-CoA synthetase, partial [Mycobacterium sp.]|nr:acyl-CoA synthetase [Mycobacterium sp.]